MYTLYMYNYKRSVLKVTLSGAVSLPVCGGAPEVLLSQPTWAFLAGEGQMITTGYIIPLAVRMPDHHHTIFFRVHVVVRLVRPPVLVLLKRRERTGKPQSVNRTTAALPVVLYVIFYGYIRFYCFVFSQQQKVQKSINQWKCFHT